MFPLKIDLDEYEFVKEGKILGSYDILDTYETVDKGRWSTCHL
ncbi:hypothetical protein ACXYMX_04910 [Sporosarcina sp. CAU 1771]